MTEKKLWNAINAELDVFQPFEATCNLLEYSVMALRVTEKNIGMLAIHFGSEIYSSGNGTPYITFFVSRPNNEHNQKPSIMFSVGDVMVLRDAEIHKWDTETFGYTFTTDETIEFRCSVCGKLSGDNKNGSYGEKHVAYQIATMAGIPQSVLADCNMKEKA